MRRHALLALAHGARTVGLLATFAGALVVGVTLHANTPAFRRLARDVAGRATAGLFAGKLAIGQVQTLAIGPTAKARIHDVEVLDPEGHPVIVAHDVAAKIELGRLLAALATTGAADVALDDVTIRTAEVVLDADATGAAGIARAFRARSEAAATATATAAPAAPGRRPRLLIARAALGHVLVHGNMVPPELDGDADDVSTHVRIENDRLYLGVDRARIVLRAPKAPKARAPLSGTVRAELGLALGTPAGEPAERSAKVAFEGSCGAVPISADARISGDHVEARLDVARTDAIADAIGDAVTVTKPVELHARAKGDLPTIGLSAEIHVGDAAATANGSIDLREGRAFELALDASRIDARTFGTAVATDLSGTVNASGNLSGPYGTFRVHGKQGVVAGQAIPPVSIEGRFEPARVTAVVRAHETGVDATGDVTLDVPTNTATFDLQVRSDALRTLARLPNRIGGAASARAQGKIDVTKKTLHATANVSADNVTYDAFGAKRFNASGIVDGPLSAPTATVGFAGVDLQVKADGKAPLVYPSATGHAKVALVPTPRIVDAAVELGQSGARGSVTASASAIGFDHGVVDVRQVRVEGLGEPLELDAQLGDGGWHVRAKSDNVDLRRAAGVTGIKQLALLPEDTRATLDIDVAQRGGHPDGHVDVIVRSEKGLGTGPMAFETHATIDRGKLVGTSKLALTGFGEIEIARAELDLPPRLDARSLEATTGTMEVRGALDLAQGAALFGGESVERVGGTASFEAHVERANAQTPPSIRGTVRTRDLEVAIGGAGKATTEIAGIDVLGHVAWDGFSQDAEVAFVSWDRHGVLGTAGAKAKVPLEAWLSGAKKLDRAALAELRVGALADVPSRDVASLPPFLRPPPLRGRVDARVEMTGTVAHPEVDVSAHAQRLRKDRSKLSGPTAIDPVDGTLEARWDGERASITFAFDERERRMRRRANGNRAEVVPAAERAPQKRAHLRGLVLVTELRANDLVFGSGGPLPWRASAEIEAEDLPLDVVPTSSPSTRLDGLLSGRARVRDVNQSPSFEANAHVDDFGVGGAVVRNVDLTAGGRDGSLFARASLTDQSSQVTIQLASNGLRMKGTEVGWDSAAPTRLDYAVQNGRLALLAPLVRRSISEIDGRVDGAGSITLDKSSQLVEGGLAVQGARLYLNVLGEEISSLDAIAKFDPSGEFRIDDARGKVGSGEFSASVSGKMNGFRLDHADVTLIATKDGIPIAAQGATFADATGEIHLSARMENDTLVADVVVPQALVTLPKSTPTLQSLDPDPTVTIGVRRRNGALDATAVRKTRGGAGGPAATTPGESLATRLTVDLGRDVRLEGRGLDVVLGGRTLVEVADELKVTGRIDLRGGSIEVHGRRFTVDHGTVTFPEGGDPGDPTVVASAYWDAPDRTRVWVEYAGPLKGGHLTLRSEPQLSPNEILSVLLFGRPDPNQATAGATPEDQGQGGAEVGTGVAAGAGFFATDLNKALSEIDPNLDVDTDTLSGNRVRAKIGRSFFDRRLKISLGIAPGRVTYRDPDTTYLFLNWQFVPKWSVVATGGDTGTTILDVLFQHRY